MKIAFRSSFARDLKRLKDQQLRAKIKELIEEIEKADNLQQIGQLKKLSASDSFYRIRIGDYRIGLSVESDNVELVRFLHRREIYRFFP